MPLTDHHTIGQAFAAAAQTWPDQPFLIVPAAEDRAYLPDGWQITYADALEQVERLAGAFSNAGYGHGHRVALLLDNRPQHVLLKLALNRLGASVAPVNPDYRAAEFAFLIDHCRPDLIITIPAHHDVTAAALAEATHAPSVVVTDQPLPHAPRPAPADGPATSETEASLLYTSGTTGRPKGCIMSHDYELAMGEWYASRGALATFGEGTDRVYNPLPLYHVNAGIMALFGVIARGNALIVTDRFSPSRWWPEVKATKATVIHYLGVVASMLMKRDPGAQDRDHAVRFGFGAGIEPTLHARAEQRFGFPFVELWGMTEACRILTDCEEPRQVGTRAIGRPQKRLEACVLSPDGTDAPSGEPGELVIRHSAETPRAHAFSGYLDNPKATEQAWAGGWFHTGDTVTMDKDGMIHFVDRAKNIIRRSGENISAAEVEAVILDHDAVAQVAVAPVDDDIREEEVLACIVPAPGHQPSATLANEIADWCAERMAYYKPPGWVLFLPELPTTGTQKIQKHRLFGEGEDPRERPDIHDLRSRKKRG